MIVGWAFGAGIDKTFSVANAAAEKEYAEGVRSPDGEPDSLLFQFGLNVGVRLMGGLILFFVLVGIAWGFESLGIGLG